MKLGIKISALALASALLLTGCNGGKVGDASPSPSQEPSPSPSQVVEKIERDGVFTLKYSAANTMNPITGSSADNMAAAELMYEGLFVLDGGFTAQPVLCESYKTEDGVSFEFQLKQGVLFSDGSPLTAEDAAYSINCARDSDRYSGRLGCIDSVYASDAYTLTVELGRVNYLLPELLDVPIIKSGSIDEDAPAGTGPYTFKKDASGARLTALAKYRDAEAAPLEVIYLKEFEASSITEEFANGGLDLMYDDPCDGSEYYFRGDYETRVIDTTLFQYIGFNMENVALSDLRIRKAIAYCVDRQYIRDTVMGGNAVAAPLLFSPAWSLYDEAWEPEASKDSAAAVAALFRAVGMSDYDRDGFLEYPVTEDSFYDLELSFVVFEGSPLKIETAQNVCAALKAVGVSAVIKALSWNDYVYALGQGDFDLYFAEVSIPASFDFTGFFTENGRLNYGGIADETYDKLLSAYSSAATDVMRADSAKRLCAYAAENLPIIPVLYRTCRVCTLRNVVYGLTPTQSSIFYGLSGSTFSLN